MALLDRRRFLSDRSNFDIGRNSGLTLQSAIPSIKASAPPPIGEPSGPIRLPPPSIPFPVSAPILPVGVPAFAPPVSGGLPSGGGGGGVTPRNRGRDPLPGSGGGGLLPFNIGGFQPFQPQPISSIGPQGVPNPIDIGLSMMLGSKIDPPSFNPNFIGGGGSNPGLTRENRIY